MDVIKGEVYWVGLQNLGSTREVPGAGSRGATSTRQGLPLGHTACVVASTLHSKRSCALLTATLLLS